MLNGRLGFPLWVYKYSYFKFLTIFFLKKEASLSMTRANNRPREKLSPKREQMEDLSGFYD